MDEPLQQHTAVRYNNWLPQAALDLRLQQAFTQTSDVRRPFRGQMQFISCSCCGLVFIWIIW